MTNIISFNEFVARARVIHKNKYDYFEQDFINMTTKTKISCKIKSHGEFWQTPDGHTQGRGCRKCGYDSVKLKKSKSLELFIEQAIKIHGNKFDYSHVNYINDRSKIDIICGIHGKFSQVAGSHLAGNGCSACSGRKKYTAEDFIKKANKIHNYKYDYSNISSFNNKTKVSIVCAEHGIFQQNPHSHMMGCGCPSCFGTQKLTTKIFIDRSNIIHNNKYDYSLVNYINSKIKVSIICPNNNHGIFEQAAGSHLQAIGCPKCAGNVTLTTEEFMAKANKVHGHKYDYSDVIYVRSNKKVRIICKENEHGSFEQTPCNHLRGNGCPKCYLKGQTLTAEYLKKLFPHNVIHVQHKIPRKNKIALRVDFAIERDEKFYFIEYNGIQHYMPCRFGGMSQTKAQEAYENQIKRDKYIANYCIENNIQLIVIDSRVVSFDKIEGYLIDKLNINLNLCKHLLDRMK